MRNAAVIEPSNIRFPDRMRLRVPRGLPAAVKAAAAKRHTSPSEWARQKLLRALEDEGVRLAAIDEGAAGA